MSYFEILGQDEIGKLEISRNEIWNSQKETVKIEGFKANVFEKNDISSQYGTQTAVYTSGWMTRVQEFCKVPLLLDYLQVNKITSTRVQGKVPINEVSIDLIIFDKYLQNFKVELIIINNTHEVKYAILVINFLNEVIDKEGNINGIDLTKFNADALKSLDRSHVLDAINKLDFECYADSSNRVGKENFFWTDFVAINLPKDTYLRNIFEKILRNNCSDFSSGNNSFSIKEYDTNEYAPAYPRRKVEGINFGQSYKEVLRYEIASYLSFYDLVKSRTVFIS